MVALVSLLLLAVIVIGALPGSPLRKGLRSIGSVASPAQRGVKFVGNKASDFWAAVTDGMAIREENEELHDEIARLRYQLTQYEEAGIKYEELREAFHIRDTFSNYDIYGASVLSREADEWFAVVRIGLGTTDGVSMPEGDSFAVVDVETNLIGRVIELEENDSTVLPLLHEGFVVSGKVNEVNGIGVTVSGDAALKAEGLCLVTGISENEILEVGAEIVTSGDGGLFPQGIPIGVIESVDYSNPIAITATLRPYADISSLNDVFVMIPYSLIDEWEEEAEESDVPSSAEETEQG